MFLIDAETFGNVYKNATIPRASITVMGIIMQSLNSVGQF